MTVQEVSTQAPLSPEQAGKIVGVNRKTIVRAIERGWLKAWRDNANQWKIDPASLRECASVHWAPSGHATQDVHPVHPAAHPVTDGLAVELAVLRERLEGVERARDAAERDRDAWREEAGATRVREDREREAAQRERDRADGAEKGREAAERERDALREKAGRGRWWWRR